MKEPPLGGVESTNERRQGLLHLCVQLLRALGAFAREKDVDRSAIFHTGSARHEPPPLGSVNKPRHRRLLETKVVGECSHPGATIPQNPAHAELGEREIVVGAYLVEHGHRDEGGLHETVNQLLIRRMRSGSL